MPKGTQPLDDKQLFLDTLREICRDKTASPQARAGAARTLGEALGLIGRHAEKPNDNKSLEDMTADELMAAAQE